MIGKVHFVPGTFDKSWAKIYIRNGWITVPIRMAQEGL